MNDLINAILGALFCLLLLAVAAAALGGAVLVWREVVREWKEHRS